MYHYCRIFIGIFGNPQFPPPLQFSLTFEEVSLYISVEFSLSLPGKFSWNLRHAVVRKIMIHRDIQVLILRICDCVKWQRGVRLQMKLMLL